MHYLCRIAMFSLIITSGFAQNYGRMQTPEKEGNADELQALMAMSVEAFAIEHVIDENQYILGPGDAIGLNIHVTINHTLPLTITPTGDLLIPAVGICHIAGLTLAEGARVVREYILSNAYPNAQVDMVLIQPRQFLLQVSGALNKPGFIKTTPLTRLDEVIIAADGFHQLAQETAIEISRSDGRIETINYHKYLMKGDLEANPTFLEGDRVFVQFGKIEENGIVVRGSINGTGYDIIGDGENLEDYIKRQVKYGKNADIRNITITRPIDGVDKLLLIPPEKFHSTILQAQDEINFNWERGVVVNGFVFTPGGFQYFPGYTAADYISMAGGNSVKGNPNNCSIRHRDGSVEYGQRVVIRRGDVIVVPRTLKDYIIGETSMLQITVSLVTIYMTFLAIGR
ncbi:MAG: SLBB domain-containing protein [Candidatus Marinimicrobia bacterium]|nr:SLBB domain-containing protein [Candidatus Neomarinimicrobiota bacterium]